MIRPVKFLTVLAVLSFFLLTCLLISAPPTLPVDDNSSPSTLQHQFKGRRPFFASSCGSPSNSRFVAQRSPSSARTNTNTNNPTPSHVGRAVPYTKPRLTSKTPPSMSPSSPRYLMYVPYAGVTNQLISIWHGSMIAKALNRTLLIPNLSPNVHVEVDGQQEPAPTRWSEFIDLKLYSRQTGLQLEELDDFLARRGIIEHKGQLRRRSGSKNMKRSVGTKPASSRNKHKKRWIQLESLVQEGQPIPKSSLETTNGATSEQEAQEPHHQGPAFVKHPVVEQCFSEAGYGMDRRVDMTGRRFMQRYAINSTLIPTPFLDPERDNNSIWARWRMDKVIERYQQPHYEEEEILCLGHVYRLLPGGNNRAWVEFGQHFHFTEKVHEFVDEILEELLPRGHQAFVGIHLRRGDFERHCMGITSPADPNGWNRCYPSVQHIISLLSGKTGGGHSVSGVTAAAHAVALASGYQKLPVLVLTNERDPTELAKADAENWIRVDHKRLGTLERFGRYGPILIDGALLARANLLVGVEYSTYFKTASKRAETWYNSQTIFVT